MNGSEHCPHRAAGIGPDFLSVTRRVVSTTISNLLLFTTPPKLFKA